PEGDGPLARVALHLVGVAGVRARPDEEVAAAQDLAVGHPGPRVVVGLAPRVMQLDSYAANFESEGVAVGAVGIAVLSRPAQVGHAELTLVDDLVVASREDVPVEAGR